MVAVQSYCRHAYTHEMALLSLAFKPVPQVSLVLYSPVTHKLWVFLTCCQISLVGLFRPVMSSPSDQRDYPADTVQIAARHICKQTADMHPVLLDDCTQPSLHAQLM